MAPLVSSSNDKKRCVFYWQSTLHLHMQDHALILGYSGLDVYANPNDFRGVERKTLSREKFLSGEDVISDHAFVRRYIIRTREIT
jgi:hypothetical protein